MFALKLIISVLLFIPIYLASIFALHNLLLLVLGTIKIIVILFVSELIDVLLLLLGEGLSWSYCLFPRIDVCLRPFLLSRGKRSLLLF